MKLLEPVLILFVVTLAFNVLLPSSLGCTDIDCVADEVEEDEGLCVAPDGMAREVEGLER